MYQVRNLCGKMSPERHYGGLKFLRGGIVTQEGGHKEKVLKAVKEAAPEGWISCPEARELAQKLGVSPREVGEACNCLKIKIRACELGCF